MNTKQVPVRRNAKRVTRHPLYQALRERTAKVQDLYESSCVGLKSARAEIDSLKKSLAERDTEIGSLKKQVTEAAA